MKNTLVVAFTLFTMLCQAQKNTVDLEDDFKTNSKKTEWDVLTFEKKAMTYFRIIKFEKYAIIQVKMILDNLPYSVNKDDQIQLKLSNGEVISLKNLKYTTSCIGCGATGLNGSKAEGINVSYTINKDQYKILTNDLVLKIKIYSSLEPLELEIKTKNAKQLQEAIQKMQ